MRSLRISLLLSCVLLLGACGAAVIRHPRPTGFWENGSSTVQVRHDKVIGTGVVVDARGLVLTNNHVIQREKDKATGNLSGTGHYKVCAVSDGEASCYKAIVIATDLRRELALLRVDHKFERAVEFAPEGELLPGDEIYMWGSYLQLLPPSPFFGRYLGLIGPPYFDEEVGVELPLLAFDNSASPGASGGPLFDSMGRCVGLTFAISAVPDGRQGRSIGLAIPVGPIKEFIKKNNPFAKK